MPRGKPKRQTTGAVRAFWSGTITFGLVSIPVDLVSATRNTGVSMRMLDAESGEPLAREYICPKDEKALDSDEIVRGYEVEPDHWVTIEDEELEALAPRKSRDIDLVRFVDREAIDPRYFVRGYFLLPGGESSKAYHLLVETMQRTGRAGIATFVMRGREYLVAIIADKGVLRAEILRFADELRGVDEIELPKSKKPNANKVKSLAKEIERLTKRNLDPSELEDPSGDELRALARQKLRAGEDVVEVSEPAPTSREPGAEVVDLMDLIKRRLGVAANAANDGGPRRSGRDVESLSKSELYERAKKLDIPGRSQMTKRELVRALRTAS